MNGFQAGSLTAEISDFLGYMWRHVKSIMEEIEITLQAGRIIGNRRYLLPLLLLALLLLVLT